MSRTIALDPRTLADLEAAVAAGDADAAVTIAAGWWPPTTGGSHGWNHVRTVEGLRARLRLLLAAEPDPLCPLTPALRTTLAVSLLLARSPAATAAALVRAAGGRLAYPALDAYVADLRQRGRPVELWWQSPLRQLLRGPFAPPTDQQRALVLAQTAAHRFDLAVRLAEIQALLAAAPVRARGVRISRVNVHDCPLCERDQQIYLSAELGRLPALPAHPGCRCGYVVVPTGEIEPADGPARA